MARNEPRWIPVYNAGSTTIPPFAVVEISSVDSGVVYVRQPTVDHGRQILINGAQAIAAGEYGQAHRDFPAAIAYRGGEGTPAIGQAWGVASGYFALRRGYQGFRITGDAQADRNLVIAEMDDRPPVIIRDGGPTEAGPTGAGGAGTAGADDDALGTMIFDPTGEALYVANAGSWVEFGSGGVVDCSASVAGKVNLSNQTLGAGTKSFSGAVSVGVPAVSARAELVQAISLSEDSAFTCTLYDVSNAYAGRFSFYQLSTVSLRHRFDFYVDETNAPFAIRILDSSGGGTTYTGQTDTDPIGNVFHGGVCVEIGTGTAFTSAGTGLEDEGGGAIGLADTAVTPDSYTFSSITVDQQGRLTAAASANVTAARVLGSVAGGAVDELTLTNVLDLVGSAAQGDILYRDASAWTRLGAGTSGHFLKTQGASANPTWAAAPGVTDHGALTGLSDDDHPIYALLAGRSGGQTLKGGTGSGDDLELQSTSNATKGDIYLNGALKLPITTLTNADLTLNASHNVIHVTATTATCTLTLPAASAASGRVYTIVADQVTGQVIQIDADGSETIDKALTQFMYQTGEVARLISDGGEWHFISNGLKPLGARLFRSSTQSTTFDVVTKAQLSSEDYDIGGIGDPSTNYRITFPRPGLYTVSFGGIWYGGTASSGSGYGILYRAGSAFMIDGGPFDAAGSVGFSGSVTLYSTGSSDYVELYVYQSNAGSPTVGGSANLQVFLSAAEVR